MIFVDTTVLVYAVGVDHAARQPCRRLIELCGSGAVRATTTAEVIQEFAHVRSRRRPRSDATALARDFASLFAPLAVVGADELDSGLMVFEQVEELGAFDAVLAATARTLKSEALVSVDRSFGLVPNLRHLDPTSSDFTQQLTPSVRGR